MSVIVEERHSPLASQVVLIVGFVLLFAAGIATVLVPELASDDEAEEQASGEVEEAPAAPAPSAD